MTCYHDVTGLIVLRNMFRPHYHDVTGLIVFRNTFRPHYHDVTGLIVLRNTFRPVIMMLQDCSTKEHIQTSLS